MNSNNNNITNNQGRIVVTTWGSLTRYDDFGLVTLWDDEEESNTNDNATNSSTSMILKQKMSSIDAVDIVPTLETIKIKIRGGV